MSSVAMIGTLKKETCGHCLKNVNIGQSIHECHKCNCVIHTKCLKLSKFSIINNNYYCQNCKILIETKYNPFKCMLDNNVDDDELSELTDLQKLSTLLEDCKSYSTDELNSMDSLCENFSSS